MRRLAHVAGVKGDGNGEREKREKNGRGLGRRGAEECLPARPPFSDFYISQQTQNSDWLILAVGHMGIELVKQTSTNFRLGIASFTEPI